MMQCGVRYARCAASAGLCLRARRARELYWYCGTSLPTLATQAEQTSAPSSRAARKCSYSDRRLQRSVCPDTRRECLSARRARHGHPKSRRDAHQRLRRCDVRSNRADDWLRADELPSHRPRSEEHTSELQSRENLVCRLLLEKKKISTDK